MRILDRERYWAFIKAYIICFIALVGLYIVIDAFTKLDEFTYVRDGTIEVLRYMGWYYGIRVCLFFDQLCGVMTMMAAIFTVTWMQRNNELLAMLAAGISTQRVIRPVLISAILVSFFVVANQEFVLPQLGEELIKAPADDGTAKVRVASRYDINGILIHGKDGDRGTQTIFCSLPGAGGAGEGFNASLPVAIFDTPVELNAKEGRYIPDDDTKSPLHGGWLLRGATITPADLVIDANAPLLVKVDDETLKRFPPPLGKGPGLSTSAYFLRTNLSFAAITRDRHWFQFARTPDLVRALSDPINDPEKVEIAVALHARMLRPILSFTLLCLSLPIVLGGDGRNMFINLGLSLGTSAVFYGVNFLSQFLGNNSVISPELSAWAPLIGFGTLAVARWDMIRT
jgi:lipopolysaccharide export system permease protein